MTNEERISEELANERAYWITIREKALMLAIQELSALNRVPENDTEIFVRAETFINYLENGIPIRPGT